MITTAAVDTTRHLTFETADLEIARDRITQVFSEHDLAVGDASRLDLRVDFALAPRLMVGRMSYGAETAIEAPPMRTYYEVNLPTSGVSSARQHGVEGAARAGEAGVALLPAGELALSFSPDEEQFVVKVRKEQLEAHAAKLTGRSVEPIDFDLRFDVRSAAAQALLAIARFLHDEFVRPGGIATAPAACHDLESALMTQLLLVVPSQLTPQLHAEPGPARRTPVHDALDILDDDPASGLDTVELAARVGISVRALQAGFRDVVGMTPTAYVRGLRLDRVHYELLRGTQRSVTEVAMDWGFYHPGRFAQQYRDRFGNLPSETARTRPARSTAQSGPRSSAVASSSTRSPSGSVAGSPTTTTP